MNFCVESRFGVPQIRFLNYEEEIHGVGRSDALGENAPAVPDSFLVGSAPRLQAPEFIGILFLFPALGKLLLSVTDLVALEYSDFQIHSTQASRHGHRHARIGHAPKPFHWISVSPISCCANRTPISAPVSTPSSKP